MNAHILRFDGSLLKWGFWIYLWRVKQGSRVVHYVGRTGDSSSPNASSPIARMGQHLSPQRRATANMLLRHLNANGIDPERSRFELFALGPLYTEQRTMQRHKPYRDTMGALERELALHLREQGLVVLGDHPSWGDVGRAMVARVVTSIDRALRESHTPKNRAARALRR